MRADLNFKLFWVTTIVLVAWSAYLIWVCVKIAS